MKSFATMMYQEHWESWDYDGDASPSWDSDDQGGRHADDEDEHEQAALRRGPITNLTTMLEKEDDLRHMFAASMFSREIDCDDLSVDSNRTVRRSNRVESSNSIPARNANVAGEVQEALPERPIDSKIEPNYTKLKSSPSDHYQQQHCISSRNKNDQIRRGSWSCVADPKERLPPLERNGYEARAA